MTIEAAARPRTGRAVLRFRGLELQVGDSADLLPALPLRVRRDDHGWEHVGHALDHPSQIGGLSGAPWSRLSGLRLRDEVDSVRLTGVAEPGARRFAITAADPLGRWSKVHWLASAKHPTAHRRRLLRDPIAPEAPGRVVWHDLGRSPLGDQWIGDEWPAETWYRDDRARLLRPAGRVGTGSSRFLGLEVLHHEFAVAARVRLLDGGPVRAGVELHVDGVPSRLGVERVADGSVRVVGSAGTISALPASTSEVDLALISGERSFALEVACEGRPVLRRTAQRSSGPVAAAGLFAQSTGVGQACLPVGFSWLEYRGGRSAVANRFGGPG